MIAQYLLMGNQTKSYLNLQFPPIEYLENMIVESVRALEQ